VKLQFEQWPASLLFIAQGPDDRYILIISVSLVVSFKSFHLLIHLLLIFLSGTRMSWRRKIRISLHAYWITRNIIWYDPVISPLTEVWSSLSLHEFSNGCHLTEVCSSLSLYVQVTPEIRRELRSSTNRGEKATDMSIYILYNPHLSFSVFWFAC
jgi:hypothetical protein